MDSAVRYDLAFEGVDEVNAVNVYLKEKEMAPFLELLAEKAKNDVILRIVVVVNGVDVDVDPAAASGSKCSQEMSKEKEKLVVEPKPSLMDKKTSAHTLEGTITSRLLRGLRTICQSRFGENRYNGSSTLQDNFSSPERTNTLPPSTRRNSSVKKRRIVRRWNLLEEDALRTAVEKDGNGNWKVILTNNKDIFEGRTEVDLKDKWRNLNKK